MRREGINPWYLRPVNVVLLLFLVLGPLGLPLLYKSPGFTRKWKIGLTILVLVYTSYLITITVDIVRNFYRIYSY